MKKTTLCYIENNGRYLMLYRNRKPDDPNEGKWLGIGGKIEEGESSDECNQREVLEETGLRLNSFVFHGIIEFRSDTWDDEDMYLYSSSDFEPADEEAARVFAEAGSYEPPVCTEGELAWVPREKLMGLPMWQGDREFLKELLGGAKEIAMTLSYTGEDCTVLQRRVK